MNDLYESEDVSRDTLGYIVEIYDDAYERAVYDGSGRTAFLGAVPDVDLGRVDSTSTWLPFRARSSSAIRAERAPRNTCGHDIAEGARSAPLSCWCLPR